MKHYIEVKSVEGEDDPNSTTKPITNIIVGFDWIMLQC